MKILDLPVEKREKLGSAASRRYCRAGKIPTNLYGGGQDPVALKDEDYPEWLWSCLDVMKKGADAADENAGDEFCTFGPPSLPD